VGDILREVYESDKLPLGEREKKLSDRFHKHRSLLRDEVNAVLRQVGLPETDLLCYERSERTSFWRLADSIQFQDLALLKDCGILLTAVTERHQDETVGDERTALVCEQFSQAVGDLSVLKKYQEMPGIRKLLRETFLTSSKALKYLAERNQTAAQKATETESKDQFLRKEEQYWSIYALLCARFAPTLPKSYEHLSQQGEMTLRKALSCCRRLRDQDRAFDLYQQYRETKEQDGIPWEPETATEQRWQSVLSLDEAA
jgi:hypothetical protein